MLYIGYYSNMFDNINKEGETMNKILIVEDEIRLREMVKEYLENEDFEIFEAGDGVEAMEKFKEFNPDLVLLDIMLPKIDGWSVLKELRKISETPVVMMTARGEEYDKLFGFELGVDDYVVKPFSLKELTARVRAVLRRFAGRIEHHNNIYEFDTLSINLDSRKVVLDEKNVSMTPKEFDLLSFLIQHQDKVYTREQLLDKIWGYEFGGDYRTVDTHIKMLRESMGSYRSLVVTVWGVGYKFEVDNL